MTEANLYSCGPFTEVATNTNLSGQPTFTHLPADGVYALGMRKDIVELAVNKSVDNAAPNIGKLIDGQE